MALTATAWIDPWEWPEFRRMRRSLRLASTLTIIAIIAAIPAAWIVLVPTDPTLRPDTTTPYAWAILAASAVLIWLGHSVARKARARFDRAVYQVTRNTKDAAAARGIALDIDMGETFPATLISRQQGMIAVCGPVPLFVALDKITSVEVVTDESPGGGAPFQPQVKLMVQDEAELDAIRIVAGRGIGRASLDQVKGLREKFTEFLEPNTDWNPKLDKSVNVAAFIDSLGLR